MAVFLQDLDQRFPIVDPETGKPTDYFLRLLRGQTGDLADGLTDADSAIAALQSDVATLEGRNIDTGFGLSGGGDLSADRTIALGNPALTDPGADRGVFWDDSAGKLDWLTYGSGLTLAGTTLTAGGGSDPDGNAALTKPLASAFTLENAGTASMTDGTNGILLTCPSATVNLRFMRYTAGLPGSSWTLTMRSRPMTPHNAVVHQRCIMMRNSTSGRLVVFSDPGTPNIGMSRWASYTAFNANIFTYQAYNADMPWRRIVCNGTTLTAWTSVDGQDWFQIGSETIATYLTATGGTLDQVGLGQVLGAASTLTTGSIFQSFTLV